MYQRMKVKWTSWAGTSLDQVEKELTIVNNEKSALELQYAKNNTIPTTPPTKK